MRKIILNDGTKYEINRCGASDGVLWIGFPEGVIDFSTVSTVFNNAEATKKIVSTYDFEGMEKTFDGYTELILIQKEYEGGLLVALRKEQQNGEQ